MNTKDIKMPDSKDRLVLRVVREIDCILHQYAAEAVKLNHQAQTSAEKPDLKPFDLEAAKRGVPLITRDGRKVEFITYLPEAKEGHRVVVFIEGWSRSCEFFDDGKYYRNYETTDDLFMAPKPLRTFYLNFQKDGSVSSHKSRDRAEAWSCADTVAAAVPVQVPWD